MQNTIFFVNDEPFCLWDFDLKGRNDEFLKGLDADYFEYCLKVHTEAEDESRASLALQVSLHHALETFFSLIGAYVQATDCAYAWLAKCTTSDLRKFVSRLTDGHPNVFSKLNIPSVCWETVANNIFHAYLPGTERQQSTVKHFSTAWAQLAHEFLDQNRIDEYNSLKHGFRIRRGGFSLSIGIEQPDGAPPLDNQMQLIGHSEFGATFLKIESIGANKKNRSIRARKTSVNWSLERTILSLQLAYMSLNNVISALQIANGWRASECRFLRPESDEAFSEPWRHTPGVTAINFDHVIGEENVVLATKQELLERVREIKEKS